MDEINRFSYTVVRPRHEIFMEGILFKNGLHFILDTVGPFSRERKAIDKVEREKWHHLLETLPKPRTRSRSLPAGARFRGFECLKSPAKRRVVPPSQGKKYMLDAHGSNRRSHPFVVDDQSRRQNPTPDDIAETLFDLELNSQPRSSHRAPFNQSLRPRERQYSAHRSTALTERRSTSPPGTASRYPIRVRHRLRPNTLRQSVTPTTPESTVPLLPPIRPSQVPRPARELRHRHPKPSAVPKLPQIRPSQLPRPARDLRHLKSPPLLSLVRSSQVPWSGPRFPRRPSPVPASQIPRPERQALPKVPYHILPQIPRPELVWPFRPPIFAAEEPVLPPICPFKFPVIFDEPNREDYCLKRLPYYPAPSPLRFSPDTTLIRLPTPEPRICRCPKCKQSRLEKN